MTVGYEELINGEPGETPWLSDFSSMALPIRTGRRAAAAGVKGQFACVLALVWGTCAAEEYGRLPQGQTAEPGDPNATDGKRGKKGAVSEASNEYMAILAEAYRDGLREVERRADEAELHRIVELLMENPDLRQSLGCGDLKIRGHELFDLTTGGDRILARRDEFGVWDMSGLQQLLERLEEMVREKHTDAGSPLICPGENQTAAGARSKTPGRK